MKNKYKKTSSLSLHFSYWSIFCSLQIAFIIRIMTMNYTDKDTDCTFNHYGATDTLSCLLFLST